MSPATTFSDDTKSAQSSTSPDSTEVEHITDRISKEEKDITEVEIEQYFLMGLSSAENKRSFKEKDRHEEVEVDEKEASSGCDGKSMDIANDNNFEESEECISLYFNLGKLYAEASAAVDLVYT